MGTLFRGSKIKLKRALKFIAELDAGLANYNANDPVSAGWDYSGAEPALRMTWKEVDPELLAAFGDAIHNMRTALDLMASELARIRGKSDRNIYFPFAASQADFPAAIKNRNFHLAGEDAVALVTQFAPYKDGNVRLRAIHDLDIEDKHTALLITQHITNDLQLSYRLDVGLNPPVVVTGTITHTFLTPPLTGLPLIKTLKELVEHIDEILEAFASMVERRSPSGR